MCDSPSRFVQLLSLIAVLIVGACGDSSVGPPMGNDAGARCDGAACDPVDAAVPPDGAADGGDAGRPPWTGVPLDRPLRVLFIGNSFTHQGPVPTLVRDIAAGVGWLSPEVDFSAPGGETLAGHRTLTETLALVDAVAWDVVVVQEYSTRATDGAGDPAGFKADATWFYDRIKAASPLAQVVLYETWARHLDHGVYPGTFADPAEMQVQIRTHYNDAADSYIPTHATATPATDVQVAPVGDAWERHLAEPDALRLHASDDYHGNATGQYLNALVLYSWIYGVVATGAPALDQDEAAADRLQAAADATTGITQVPPSFAPAPFAVGQSVQLDFGTLETPVGTWVDVIDCAAGTAVNVMAASGASTAVDVRITDAFTGANEYGVAANLFGYPDTVSQDVCWTGSFDGHAAALAETGAVVLEDVAPGRYEIRIFASRTEDDGGIGRLTRYTVHGQSADLEISDNAGEQAVFAEVSPDASGQILIEVSVSPAGTGRFAYLGAVVLTKTSE